MTDTEFVDAESGVGLVTVRVGGFAVTAAPADSDSGAMGVAVAAALPLGGGGCDCVVVSLSALVCRCDSAPVLSSSAPASVCCESDEVAAVGCWSLMLLLLCFPRVPRWLIDARRDEQRGGNGAGQTQHMGGERDTDNGQGEQAGSAEQMAQRSAHWQREQSRDESRRRG